MEYSTYIVCSLLPLLLDEAAVDGMLAGAAERSLQDKIGDIVQTLAESASRLSQEFLGQPVDPERTFNFEHQLNEQLRETGRQIVQAVFNHAEPAAESLPKHVRFDASLYTRLNRKTPQNVWMFLRANAAVACRLSSQRQVGGCDSLSAGHGARADGRSHAGPGRTCGRAHE